MAGIAIHDQTIETIWTELESGLDSIFKKQDRVSPMRYMELYTYGLKFCDLILGGQKVKCQEFKPENKFKGNKIGLIINVFTL